MFCGISPLVDYLMPNPVFIDDLLVNSFWVTLFLNELLELLGLHTVKFF